MSPSGYPLFPRSSDQAPADAHPLGEFVENDVAFGHDCLPLDRRRSAAVTRIPSSTARSAADAGQRFHEAPLSAPDIWKVPGVTLVGCLHAQAVTEEPPHVGCCVGGAVRGR